MKTKGSQCTASISVLPITVIFSFFFAELSHFFLSNREKKKNEDALRSRSSTTLRT